MTRAKSDMFIMKVERGGLNKSNTYVNPAEKKRTCKAGNELIRLFKAVVRLGEKISSSIVLLQRATEPEVYALAR